MSIRAAYRCLPRTLHIADRKDHLDESLDAVTRRHSRGVRFARCYLQRTVVAKPRHVTCRNNAEDADLLYVCTQVRSGMAVTVISLLLPSLTKKVAQPGNDGCSGAYFKPGDR
jgi:hypothetical protein